MNYIESKDNSKIKLIRKLFQRKNREAMGLTIVEGLRSVEQALTSDVAIDFVVLAEDQEHMLARINKQISEEQIYLVKNHLFESISDTVNSQGIIAIVKIPAYDLAQLILAKAQRLLLVDQIQDPGNLGTLIRTADAAGFDGVLYTKGTVDVYSSKVNRSAMGSNLYMPLYAVSEDQLTHLAEDYAIYATTLSENSKPYAQISYGTGYIIAVGNEANGLSEHVVKLAKECINIPMYGKAESLNVAIAGSIVMYKSLEK